MRTSLFRSAFTILCFLFVVHGNSQTPCEITCPGNVTVVATSASGAVVNYGAITSSGDCGIITSLPASGSVFPIGVTTVNVYKNPSQLVYALKANTLVTFYISDPSVVSGPLTITGLQSGESIRSIDFRVSDGKLFAVGMTSTSGGNVGRLYTINIITGAATQVGSETFPLPGGLFFGPGVSIDIDPRDNMIRLVTDEDLNMRINPTTGAYTVDGVLDPNNRSVSGIAYSNNIPFATTTTLYDIGFGTQIPIGANTLYIQDPNKGTLEEIGTTGIGAFSSSFGFDISQTGDALVSAKRSTGTFPNIQQVPTLFRINLQTGIATNIGTIGTTVEDITIAPVSFTEPSCSFTVNVSPPPPTVTINKAATQPDPASTSPVKFTVVFSEDVTGFDGDDISFAGSTASGALSAIVTGSGTTYEVSISGMTSAGDIVASVPAGSASNGNGQLNIASTSTDNVVFLSGVPPTITCPGDITVNSPQGGCSAIVSFTGENDIQFNGTGNYTVLFYVSNNGVTIASGINLPSSYSFPSGVNNVQVTIADEYGSATCNFKVTVADTQPPVLNCSNRTVDALPGRCYADVPYLISGTENCARFGYPVTVTTSTGYSFTSTSVNFSPNNIVEAPFAVGTTTILVTATDAAGNTATCSYTITVVDKQNPVITNCPSAVTVSCASEVPSVNITAVTATDNCGTPTITHVGDVITNQICANKYTITRTYKATDGSGNTTTCSQTITVADNTPPTITGLTPSKRILAPPNHKMVDITLAYTINDNCVNTPNVTVNIASNEPINGTGDGDTDPDWEIIDDNHIRLRAERSAQGTGRIYTITVTVNDGCNTPVSASTEVVVAHNITGPHSGNSFKVGSTVAFTGEFWDVPGNKHTAKWLIDGASVTGVVTEPVGAKNGKVTGSYKFTTPGVYKLQMNITDQKGVMSYANTNGDLEAIVVIYDPNGGYTYGGGYFNSPAGALVANPSSAGKASYGFAMNYFKNSTNPKGETQFEFKVGDFEFNALNFDYLVISNSMSQFKGTGKIIGGQSGIGFTMTVVDGQLDGTGIDKIRMKIYNKNNGRIIYDNQPGASDAALPTQAVGINSSIVISGNNSNLTKSNTINRNNEMEVPTKVPSELDVIAYPNPTANIFSITIQSDKKERIMMQVVDMYGRILETRNVTVNSIIRFGDRYRAGTYFVKIMQGRETKQLKLIKISE